MRNEAKIVDSIDNTPLFELCHVVPDGCARILVKLESHNPTGSMKDRMAVVAGAISRGNLVPGGSVVEYTGDHPVASRGQERSGSSGHPYHRRRRGAYAVRPGSVRRGELEPMTWNAPTKRRRREPTPRTLRVALDRDTRHRACAPRATIESETVVEVPIDVDVIDIGVQYDTGGVAHAVMLLEPRPPGALIEKSTSDYAFHPSGVTFTLGSIQDYSFGSKVGDFLALGVDATGREVIVTAEGVSNALPAESVVSLAQNGRDYAYAVPVVDGGTAAHAIFWNRAPVDRVGPIREIVMSADGTRLAVVFSRDDTPLISLVMRGERNGDETQLFIGDRRVRGSRRPSEFRLFANQSDLPTDAYVLIDTDGGSFLAIDHRIVGMEFDRIWAVGAARDGAIDVTAERAGAFSLVRVIPAQSVDSREEER